MGFKKIISKIFNKKEIIGKNTDYQKIINRLFKDEPPPLKILRIFEDGGFLSK